MNKRIWGNLIKPDIALQLDREFEVAMQVLTLDGYMAYLYAREDEASHITAMHIAFKAQRANTDGFEGQQ